MKTWVPVLIFLIAAPSYAANIRLRWREHVEWTKVDYGSGTKVRYFGLSNTVNLWVEEPFEYSFGLAFGPVLGSGRLVEGQDTPAGTNPRIKLYTLGLEGKVFFSKGGLFTRLGAGYQILDTRSSLGQLTGFGAYGGLGWEIHLSKKITIVPEFAVRQVFLSGDSSAFGVTPSLALHFYTLPKDFLKM